MKDDQIRIRFTWQPKKTTRDGILANYLKTSPDLSDREQMIQTARMCWLPIALSQAGNCPSDALEILAKRSIQELHEQIQRIARSIDLINDEEFLKYPMPVEDENEPVSFESKPKNIGDFDMF